MKKPAAKCNHEDSRLTCVECSAPICGSCFVQCPVGFRCGRCAKSTVATTAPSQTQVVVRALAACGFVGFGAGWIMPWIQIPFFSCIICFFLGSYAGRWLAGFADYRLGDHVGKVIVFGIIAGMALTPMHVLPMALWGTVVSMIQNPAAIVAALTAIVSMLFSPICFFIGILRSTIWS